MNAVIEDIQDNVYGRLLADAALSTIVILEERKGVTTNELAATLSTQTARGGKKGAALLIATPTFTVTSPSAVGPRLELEFLVRCLEKPLVNRATANGGSGITAEQLAIRVLQLLHHFIIFDLPLTINAHRIEAVVYASGEREYAVHFKAGLQPVCVPKTPDPKIVGPAAAVTISGPAGSAVWYTTDGSYPVPGAGTAQQIGIPVLGDDGQPLLDDAGDPVLTSSGTLNLASGTLVRAVAYPSDPDNQASNVAALTVS